MLKVYNSLSNKIEDFETINSKKVNMYVCGPTVWYYIHVGNARPVIFFDVVRRYLEFVGYDVNFASNITDVDDKIIKQAKEENMSEKELALKYEKAFFEDYDRLNSLRPHLAPRATQHIDDIIEYINELIKKEYAYVVDGDVYFRVNKIKDYGLLSNQQVDFLKEGARISVNNKKENPNDFTLWKETTEGIKWDTKFGSGRPGWHTECVVMIKKIFGDYIDIHGGGSDLKFPHHENEIAQASALSNKTLAKYWMHNSRLMLNGEKMSKSLGNGLFVKDFKTLDELMTLRLLIVSAPYRGTINYTDELVNSFKIEYEKIKRAYKQAFLMLDYNNVSKSDVEESYMEVFKSHMNDDFNTPNVLTLIHQIIKDLNNSIRQNNFDDIALKFNSLNQILEILGIKVEATKMDDELRQDYNAWIEARNVKDFVRADEYRNILMQKGVL